MNKHTYCLSFKSKLLKADLYLFLDDSPTQGLRGCYAFLANDSSGSSSVFGRFWYWLPADVGQSSLDFGKLWAEFDQLRPASTTFGPIWADDGRVQRELD